MTTTTLVNSNEVRARFSKAMSEMYQNEVPQYGTLLELVADINARTLASQPALCERLTDAGELDRLQVERHGAIRLGTPEELSMIRRVFAVMGMMAVGYYDLSVAGVPVHSTAFRPITDDALACNPFRVFTSLLRLELIDDVELRKEAASILAQRRIFTPRVIELTEKFESHGGLDSMEADEFVSNALETFRWQSEATVTSETYQQLHKAHRLVADVVCFKGPHINHLTPRTLDIDAAQLEMPRRGITAKDTIEGPPRRKCPILLRQTSFKALEERIAFKGESADTPGTHTARFGEIEQRGVALTSQGRTLYDQLLNEHRQQLAAGNKISLDAVFAGFPDDYDALRETELAFFRYVLTPQGKEHAGEGLETRPLNVLVEAGYVKAEPITYEDFLPVSAAGIFQSNLGGTEQKVYVANAAREEFEHALGAQVIDEISLYESAQRKSIEAVLSALAGRD